MRHAAGMAKNCEPDLAGAVAAMRKAPARGRGRRSPVYQWLAARHDALAALFEKEPPSWTALARYLGEGGITASDGLPPTASTVRSVWLRVAENAARRKARQAAEVAKTRPTRAEDDEPAGDTPLPADFGSKPTPIEDEPERPKFTFLKDKE